MYTSLNCNEFATKTIAATNASELDDKMEVWLKKNTYQVEDIQYSFHNATFTVFIIYTLKK